MELFAHRALSVTPEKAFHAMVFLVRKLTLFRNFLLKLE